MQFFLGTHCPQWLERLAVPMFVSHLRLKGRRTFPRARGPWALDSGGFSELSLRGQWTVAPHEYVNAIRRYQREIGNLQWAAAQDWMCEPFITAKTGLSIMEHQRRTVVNYLELRSLAPELPIIPVLQGYSMDDYMRCREVYDRCGVDLTKLPLVGLGSVCRRQHTKEIQQIARTLSMEGIKLHGFGIKLKGRDLLQDFLVSSDSMAWSFAARRSPPLKGHTHKNCANCMEYAENWYWRVVGLDENAQRNTKVD